MAGKEVVLQEGKVEFSVAAGVFYNPEMELCRDLASLCIGALGERVSVLDAMCATGVRGLRYKKENKNVGALVLADISERAAKCARKNALKNKIPCRVVRADACDYLRERQFDFVELDPFGAPAPYLHDAARSFSGKDAGWLSLTATDMAVLCGAHYAACLKNYGAVPLDNEFCHENAARILAGKVALSFSPFNLAASPIFTLSHRHYLKMVFRVSRGSAAAVDAVKKLGFATYCPSCCFREAKRMAALERCPSCGHLLQFAGPLYTGRLWDPAILQRMLEENAQRGYRKAAQIEKLLRTQLSESKISSFGYYDLHVVAKKLGIKIPPVEEALERLRANGFSAQKTHFCPTAIKTDAPHGVFLEVLKG